MLRTFSRYSASVITRFLYSSSVSLIRLEKLSYDIVLNKPRQSYDIYIYNLVNRQSVYGDELDPLIFHLTESTVDCLLDVSLLESALLYRYDDRTLGSLDRFPVSVLGYGGGYNYFSLSGTATL